MFKVTNNTKNPQVFTNRWGQQHAIMPGTTEDDVDLDQDTGDYIAALQEAGEAIRIEGEADTTKERPMPKTQFSGKKARHPVIAQQTGGASAERQVLGGAKEPPKAEKKADEDDDGDDEKSSKKGKGGGVPRRRH